MELQAYAHSIPGRVKKINQDQCTYKVHCEDGYLTGLFAVADGVGSLQHGEIASAMAMAHINRWWRQTQKRDKPDLLECLPDSLLHTYQRCNKELLQYNTENKIRSATTLTSLFMEGSRFYGVHIGDSRILRIRTDTENLEQLTHDHSKTVTQQIDGKQVTKKGLTAGIGYKAIISPQFISGNLQPGDIFVVCTDGVYKRNAPIVLESLAEMYSHSMEQFAKAMVLRAVEEGETDNITALAVKVG